MARKPSFDTYHRNGISGCGFFVGVAEGALCVEFDDSETLHRISVSLDILHEVDTGCHERLPCLADCEGSVWLVSDVDVVKTEGTFVAFHTPDAPDKGTAVLKVSMIPDVAFGYNSWRGDHWDPMVRKWHHDSNTVVGHAITLFADK